MSCNYADGLSPYEHKGKLGLPELKEAAEVVRAKSQLLAQWIKEAKHVVFHTGAGISTAAGIPDFRGPNGVWTLERLGMKPTINTSFDKAEPTKTHMILRSMIEQGHAKFIISQNIDGLHLKSGMKRTHLAELHGNMFVAKCSFCYKFTVLSHCAETVGEKPVGLDCPFKKPGGRSCRGRLHDTLLDWEADLPANELESADHHSTLADLSICLGTTLQIVPAGNLPLRAKKNPNGRLVIINLQSTKHDKKADLLINSTVDAVMEKVADHLGITTVPYSAEIDPTKLLEQSVGAQKNALMDWTIPASAIRQLRKLVKCMPKKEAQKRPPKKRKRSPSPTPPRSHCQTTHMKKEEPTPKTICDRGHFNSQTNSSQAPVTVENKVQVQDAAVPDQQNLKNENSSANTDIDVGPEVRRIKTEEDVTETEAISALQSEAEELSVNQQDEKSHAPVAADSAGANQTSEGTQERQEVISPSPT